MKLHATVASERASKGQGGEYLDIAVKGENRETILELNITQEGGNYIVKGYAINHNPKGLRSESYIHYELTGERQKGECLNDECQNKRDEYHGALYCTEHLRKMGFLN